MGGGDAADEGARVGALLASCAARGVTLRLDANQAWAPEDARAFVNVRPFQ